MSENFAVINETSDDLDGKFLSFHIYNAVYGVELFNVIEIISVQAITKVPHLPRYIKGITNLRGKMVPVIDVRLKFMLPEKEYDDKTCIIVVSINNMQVGLIVDSVSDVVTVSTDSLVDFPNFENVNINKYLKSIIKTNNQVVLNIDCMQFFADDLVVHF